MKINWDVDHFETFWGNCTNLKLEGKLISSTNEDAIDIKKVRSNSLEICHVHEKLFVWDHPNTQSGQMEFCILLSYFLS